VRSRLKHCVSNHAGTDLGLMVPPSPRLRRTLLALPPKL
jgi:hypothetical protein